MNEKNPSSGCCGFRKKRRGVAAAELAVCLPVIVLLVLGTMEACTMIFLKQSLTVASYEGARMALADGATSQDVQDTCEDVLSDRRVSNARVTITPSNLATVQPGEYVTITISAPSDSNAILRNMFYRGKTITASASMMNEFGVPDNTPSPTPTPTPRPRFPRRR
jgi:Flp pilus assembly protein TadG